MLSSLIAGDLICFARLGLGNCHILYYQLFVGNSVNSSLNTPSFNTGSNVLIIAHNMFERGLNVVKFKREMSEQFAVKN